MWENISISGQELMPYVHTNKQVDHQNTKTPRGKWIRHKMGHWHRERKIQLIKRQKTAITLKIGNAN